MKLTARLGVIVAKQLQELPFEKRQGSSIARAWANRLAFDVEKSTSEACSLLSTLEFIPQAAKALSEEPQAVVERLEEVRKHCESTSFRFSSFAHGSAGSIYCQIVSDWKRT